MTKIQLALLVLMTQVLNLKLHHKHKLLHLLSQQVIMLLLVLFHYQALVIHLHLEMIESLQRNMTMMIIHTEIIAKHSPLLLLMVLVIQLLILLPLVLVKLMIKFQLLVVLVPMIHQLNLNHLIRHRLLHLQL